MFVSSVLTYYSKVAFLHIKYVLYQASVIFASYCHRPAVLGNLLLAPPHYTDVNDFLEITESLPLLKTNINGV